MYLIYLVTAFSLVIGVGMFAPYDRETRKADLAEDNRMEIASNLQVRFARALRRFHGMDPSAFPDPAADEYKRIEKQKILAAIDFPGYLDMGISQFYLDSEGNVLGVMTKGRLAPVDGNGDLVAGVSAPPLFVKALLRDLYGKEINGGPFGNRKIGDYDPPVSVIAKKGVADGEIAPSITEDTLKDTLSGEEFASIPEAYVTKIAKLDFLEPDVAAAASVSGGALKADLAISLDPRKSFSLAFNLED